MNSRFNKVNYLFLGISFLLIIGCNKGKKVPTENNVTSTKSVEYLRQKISAAKKGNKKLVIEKNYDLGKGTLDIDDLELVFEKEGLIQNGKIRGNNSKLPMIPAQYFKDVKLIGSWDLEKGYLEWFVGNDIKNSLSNFKALSNLVDIGVEVQLLKMYPIKVANNKSVFKTNQPIKIRGKNKNKSGLILETKHQNVFYNYFQNDKGNSLSLKNLTLQTRDFLNNIFPNNEADYRFAGVYFSEQFNANAKPNIDFISVENCIINGAVGIAAYGSHSINQSISDFKTKNKVKTIQIKNNQFNYCNAAFGFSNMGYEKVEVTGNKVYNFSSSFISFPASGIDETYFPPLFENRKQVTFTNNEFKNDHVIQIPSGRAMTPFVIKGGNGKLIFKNNEVTNLLSDSRDGQVNTFYYKTTELGKAEVHGNTFYNVIGRGSIRYPASLIKQRGVNTLILEGNTFEITKAALAKIGVIKSEQSSLRNIKGKDFLCEFLQEGTFSTLTKKYTIRNNTFKMPFLNKSSEVFDIANFIFENNTFEIGYFGQSKIKATVTEDNVLFLGRHRIDRQQGKSPLQFISRNNKIKINGSESSMIHFIKYTTGIQNGHAKLKDERYNYTDVIFDDEIFTNNLTVSYCLMDTKNQTITSKIFGKNNDFRIDDFANVNHQRPNVQNLSVDYKIENYKGRRNTSPFTIALNGKQQLSVSKNSSNTINILDLNLRLLLFNLKENLPLITNIKINYKYKNGKKGENDYNFIIGYKYREFYHANEKNEIVYFSGFEEEGKQYFIHGNQGACNFRLLMTTGNGNKDKSLKVQFVDAQDIESFTVDVETKSYQKYKSTGEFQKSLKKKNSSKN